MNQINIRIPPEEMGLLKKIAADRGISISELAKRAILDDIRSERVDFAFKLLKEGKIGFKHTWKISGLDYNEFLNEWARRGAHEEIPLELVSKNISDALELDLSSFIRNG